MSSTEALVNSFDVITEEAFPKDKVPSENKNADLTFDFELFGIITVPLLLIIGTIANVLTVFVTKTKEFRHMKVATVMGVLAITDSIVLLMVPFNKAYIRRIMQVDVRSYAHATCSIFYWLFRTAKMTSSWFVVLICVERFIAVWLPLHVASIVTHRVTNVAICSVILIIGGYNGFWSYNMDLLVNNICVPNTTPLGFEALGKVLVPLGIIMYGVVPSIILLVLSLLIIGKLWRTHEMLGDQATMTKQLNMRRTTLMLMGIAMAFFILVTPIGLSHLIAFIVQFSIFQSKIPWVVVMREVTQLMELLNYSTNFFLYMIGGSSFRKMTFQVLFKRNKKLVARGSAYTSSTSQ